MRTNCFRGLIGHGDGDAGRELLSHTRPSVFLLSEVYDVKKNAIETLVDEVLDGTNLDLRVDNFQLQENLETREVRINCNVHHNKTGEKVTIEGHGVGIVDAFFQGIISIYSQEFSSLQTIRFNDLEVKASIDKSRQGSLSDSMAEVILAVANSEGKYFSFPKSQSVTGSCIRAVLRAAEFFVNTERAVIAVYKALEHAKEAGRHDSIARYTAQLATLVEATSYSDVIDRIRRESLNPPAS